MEQTQLVGQHSSTLVFQSMTGEILARLCHGISTHLDGTIRASGCNSQLLWFGFDIHLPLRHGCRIRSWTLNSSGSRRNLCNDLPFHDRHNHVTFMPLHGSTNTVTYRNQRMADDTFWPTNESALCALPGHRQSWAHIAASTYSLTGLHATTGIFASHCGHDGTHSRSSVLAPYFRP